MATTKGAPRALVALAAASARVIGAHERLYDLIAPGAFAAARSRPLSSKRLSERLDAHAEWRTAHARAAILIPRNEPLHAAISAFGRARATAIVWILDYQRHGPSFSFADHEESEMASWQAMRQARLDLIVAGQAIVLEDERWLPVLRKRRRERIHHQLAALDAARNRAADAAPDDPRSMSG